MTTDQVILWSPYSRITGTDVAWATQCNTDHVLFERLLSIRHYWLCYFNTKSYNLLLSWSEVRKSGIAFWLRQPDNLTFLVEEHLSKSSYQLNTSLDEASLWYIVSGKISLLRLLHNAQKPINHQIVNFLMQDFQSPKWRAAASKNAYSLLQKRRYQLAVGFFILSQEYQEALNRVFNMIALLNPAFYGFQSITKHLLLQQHLGVFVQKKLI
ncbi:uncharacterized protein LOC128884495 [Hylaeus volcanicus]|uniref:uncharacterized protein LOC128884495 n=1 Tax=Hylaeus volcanicus TaxID=313075 RepID=UPI0023B7FFB4|nr:uncharacterized protein LOC128884495 [Hylaeus volcanicus]